MSSKIIYDVIHGYVKISPICLKINDKYLAISCKD